MFRHYTLLIFRNFKRSRSILFINLVGLSTALTSVLLIYLWVGDERSVDKFNVNGDRLYHVKQNMKESDGIHTGPGTPGLLAKALADEIPEVEYGVAVVPSRLSEGKGIVTVGDKRIKVGTQYASADFFKVFSYRIIDGDGSLALTDPKSVVITDALCLKLFNTTNNIVGKTIEWSEGEKKELYSISAICESAPTNATNQFDIILNYELFLRDRDWLKTWTSSDPYTYVLLKPGTSAAKFNDKISDFVYKKDKNSRATLLIQPYGDGYLYGRFENGKLAGGRIEYIRLLSIIALFILVIASINYMNLATARASRKIKEVGIRKAIGANRKTLAFQYLLESLVMTSLAMIVAVLLTDLLLEPFNLITGKQLSLTFDRTLITSILGGTIVTGVLAGSYPALYLSGFSPSSTLKGKLNVAMGELWARKGLVIFQFTISFVLIVSVLIVYNQINFIQSKNLGYSRDHVIYFDTEKTSEAFLTSLKSTPGVSNAARFYHDLTGTHGSTYAIDWEGRDPNVVINFGNLEMGYDLIETMGFKMAAGKPFSRSFGSIDQIIFNEAAIEAMGLKDPVGKVVNIWGFKREIVGVVQNFNFESMYQEVKPCFLFLVPMIDGMPSRIMVKLASGAERETLARIRELHQQNNAGLPFDFTFMDEDYDRLYAAEQRVATLSQYFAGIAIVISCLGLFGLAAFTAERRSKEIGIRKVLGSSNVGIVYLLSGEFTRIVVISVVIGVPVSYTIVRHWLDNFAYKIPLEWWYFMLAGGAALFIAWFTVGIQAVRASRINPVQYLKEE